ncbi:HGxxPAAW family protein [Streptomyces sp. V4-01]|uniref:HGxxPAAW family protein n=1 Tax=Actinacidiphila polyblastidii TaxID=3110430 RepID=A0ABU7P6U4_9ACTN|nr:HGxxPAAW family protein [Streptomyces sp. V4-01]
MAAHHDHGHTPAAWTGVIIAFIGFLVSGAFMVAASPVGFWVGIGVILLGAVVGGVMHLLGMGKKPEPLVRTSDLAAKDEARVHAGA